MSPIQPFSKAWWMCGCINVCMLDRWKDKLLWCNPQWPWPACRERNRAEATRGFGSKPWGLFVPSPSQPVFPSLLWSILASNHRGQYASPLFPLSLLLPLKPSFLHNGADYSYKVCVNLFTPLHVSHRAFLSRFATHSAQMRQQAYTRLLKCVQQDKTISLKKQHLINPEHNNASPHFSGFIPVI